MKQFVAPDHRKKSQACEWILNHPGPLVIVCDEPKRKRSVEQNARYWAILTHIADQVPDEIGRKYSPETWHEFFKAKFLGKDVIVMDGEPVLVQKTTTKLKVLEFGDYMTQVEVWAVEHQVRFFEDLANVG